MTTVIRRPLASRALPFQLHANVSPLNSTKPTTATTKRTRSPDCHEQQSKASVCLPFQQHANAQQSGSVPSLKTANAKRSRSPDGNEPQNKTSTTKRYKCVTPEQERKDRERRKTERDAQKEEFRIKYTKAFPSWTFYFDTSDAEKERLACRVLQLNAQVAKFFSNEVTHFITNNPVPSSEVDTNKENVSKARSATPGLVSVLKSPIKLRGRTIEDNSRYGGLVKKAIQLSMKIWDTAKLDSVLVRCLVPPEPSASQEKATGRSLNNLLESERRHGTTSERDPTQKRHDYHYFAKNSYFVLVEDMRQEFATIAAMEYPIKREADGREKGDWPVLHCHPLARGPFVEYNEKEERRRERMEKMEKEREKEKERERLKALEAKKRKQQIAQQLKGQRTDLRRSVSMSHLHREDATSRLTAPAPIEDDTASGYLGSTGTSGYVAASGNSVGITSTYGTTSTCGMGSSRRVSQALMPAALRGRLQAQVVTSRKVGAGDRDKAEASASSAMMPPPAGIPEKRAGLLRKSKSTNTLRLPKRDEGSKPGYCESCRMKFEDFKIHVKGRKHQKFAMNDVNFLQLDFVLSRVKRRTKEEVEAEEAHWSRGEDFSEQMAVENADGDGEDDDIEL